jgi:hypothetical protein
VVSFGVFCMEWRVWSFSGSQAPWKRSSSTEAGTTSQTTKSCVLTLRRCKSPSIPAISDEGDEEHRDFEYRQHDVHILILGIGFHQYKARQSRAVTVRGGEFVPCSRAIARSR